MGGDASIEGWDGCVKDAAGYAFSAPKTKVEYMALLDLAVSMGRSLHDKWERAWATIGEANDMRPTTIEQDFGY